ncbi:MAG: ABC transporter substrate-binding protein [Chloroflexi bacterium]|nr:ABC transporter substrate-binding protein [Chloroflexota bacterium]
MKEKQLSRREFLRLATVVGAGALAAACAPATPAPAQPSAGEAAKEAAKEVTTVTWYVRTSPEEQPWEKEIVIPAFEEAHPDIKINLVITPWDDFDTKMQAMIAAGDPPDIWSHWGPSGFQDYVIRGLVADQTPFIERDNFDLSDFVPEVLDIYKVEGKYYGLPILTGASYIFYNKKIFDEAGVPYPPTDWNDANWTFEQFLDTAQKLTQNPDDPTKAIYGFHDGTWPLDAWPWMWGQDLYPEEAYKTGFASEAYLDSPKAIEAFQARQDLTFKHKVAPSPAATEALSAGGNPFHTGRVAMQAIGVWGWWVHKGLEEQFDFGVAALPIGAEGRKAVIFTDPWMLSSKTDHPDEAWEFLKFLVSKDSQKAYMEAVGAPPVRKSLQADFFKLYPSMTPQEAEEAFIGGVQHGAESPNHLLVRFDQINNVITSALDPVMLGEKPAAEVLPEADKELEKTLEQIRREFGQ